MNKTSGYPTNPGTVGVIMLDTQFPRFRGDIGNGDTWPFGVIYKMVPGATAKKTVEATSEQNLQPFIDAALDLQDQGAVGITTSCGFLCLAQAQIASQLSVPFIASSLAQVPWVQIMLPADKMVGILTIDAKALTKEHLLSVGIDLSTPVKGCENGSEFNPAILSNRESMSIELCERDNVTAAMQLLNENPAVGAFVLECTNMAPYARAIHQATGLPVYSIYTLIRWFQSGLSPVGFSNPGLDHSG